MRLGRRQSSSDEVEQAIREAGKQGDFRKACQLAEKGVADYPDSAELWARTASLRLWSDKREEAHAALSKARELGPDNATAWAAEADVACFEARYVDATSAAKHALALDESDPWVLERCVSAYLGAQDYEEALRLSARWCELFPEDDDAVSMRANLLGVAGRTQEREELLAESLRKFPDSGRMMLQRSRQLQQARELTEAATLLRKLVKKCDGNFTAWAELASVLGFLKQTDEAEAAAKRALAISGCAIRAMTAMDYVCRQRDQEQQAAEWRSRATETIPAMRVSMSVSAATQAVRKGEWEKVLELIEPALAAQLHPIFRNNALGQKARALIELKRIEEAARVVAELVGGGDGSTLHELKGRVLQGQGDLEGAVAVFREGIAKYPTEGTLRSHLLRALHALGRTEEKTALIAETFDSFPEMPAGVVMMYMALDETGHQKEARRMREMGMQRFPGAEDLRLFEAIEKLQKDDLTGASKAASGVTGEWKPIAERLQGISSLRQGVENRDWPKILASAESLLSRKDSTVKPEVALQTKAIALYQLDRFEEAKEVLDQLTAMGVDSPAVTRLRWRIQERTKEKA